jgi:3-methyladenine DNA glycosylase AlkD
MGRKPLSKLLTGIHEAVRAYGSSPEPTPERRFHKHDEYVSYHLYATELRAVWKEFRPRLVGLSVDERLELASLLLAQHIGELGHIGIGLIALSSDGIGPQHFDYFDHLLDHFRSWSHVDSFSADVVRPLLRRHRKATLKLLRQWNRSSNRFKRRMSVVAFTRKVGESGDFTEEMLRLCDNLIWDPEDIVQKGVGWTLKDNLRSAPDRIIPYVKELRRKGVRSTITLYAIRDLKGPKRAEVLKIKKK